MLQQSHIRHYGKHGGSARAAFAMSVAGEIGLIAWNDEKFIGLWRH
jgi:hypothetical protein